MNKEDLVRIISAKARVSQKDAAECLNATLDSITRALARGQKVTLVGFGSFRVRTRAARQGRNPRTGAVLDIPARKSAVWVAGKALKDRVEAGGRSRRQLVGAGSGR
ncbi:MAG: HU family DNA-binding protein [Cyanobacteria bacterium REEB65]|nr:HU family DNA-binding protein [Cyanobacteria bacterium REEB65]